MAKKIFNIISTVFLILLIILVAMMFFARFTGNSPSVFGYHFYRVATGSMEPTLMTGDVILVKEAPAESIAKDDIVTYKAKSGEMTGREVTHRVVAEPEIKDGVYWFQTQGDRSGAPLDPRITYDQIIGKFVTKLPILDKVYSFFLTPYGLIAVVAVIIVLFGFEMISLFSTYKNIDEIDEKYTQHIKEQTEKDSNDTKDE
jgi:signal peptidase